MTALPIGFSALPVVTDYVAVSGVQRRGTVRRFYEKHLKGHAVDKTPISVASCRRGAGA